MITGSRFIIFIALLVAMVVVMPPALADNAPTVTISDYNISPPVMMPGSLGTITITVKNTASSASITERSGQLSQGDYTQVQTTDINVNIQNIHLEGNGIKVLTQDFDRVGESGPGQSIPITFSIQAPDKSGIYYPEVWIDTLGATEHRNTRSRSMSTPQWASRNRRS